MSRPAHLDVSALSPIEFDAYLELISEAEVELGLVPGDNQGFGFGAKNAGAGRGSEGRVGDWPTVMGWLQTRVDFDRSRENEILAFFKTPSASIPSQGRFLALLRLIAHSSSCSVLCRDHIFIQTQPLPFVSLPSQMPSPSRTTSFQTATSASAGGPTPKALPSGLTPLPFIPPPSSSPDPDVDREDYYATTTTNNNNKTPMLKNIGTTNNKPLARLKWRQRASSEEDSGRANLNVSTKFNYQPYQPSSSVAVAADLPGGGGGGSSIGGDLKTSKSATEFETSPMTASGNLPPKNPFRDRDGEVVEMSAPLSKVRSASEGQNERQATSPNPFRSGKFGPSAAAVPASALENSSRSTSPTRPPPPQRHTPGAGSISNTQTPLSPPLPPRPKVTDRTNALHGREERERSSLDLPPPQRKNPPPPFPHSSSSGRKIHSTVLTSISAPSALSKPQAPPPPPAPKLLASTHLGPQTRLRMTPSPAAETPEPSSALPPRSDVSNSSSTDQKYTYSSPTVPYPNAPAVVSSNTNKKGSAPAPPSRRATTDSAATSPVDPFSEPLPHSTVFPNDPRFEPQHSGAANLSRAKTLGSGHSAKPGMPPPPPRRRPESMITSSPSAGGEDLAVAPQPFIASGARSPTVASGKELLPPAVPRKAPQLHHSKSMSQSVLSSPAHNSHPPEETSPSAGGSAASGSTTAKPRDLHQLQALGKDLATIIETGKQSEWLSKATQKFGVRPGGKSEKQALMRTRSGRTRGMTEETVDEEEFGIDRDQENVQPGVDITEEDDEAEMARMRERVRIQKEAGWSRLD